MQIYVSGSMAYDRIMNFPGKFSDHILPEKIHALSVSFTVSSLVERTGGTAGNIAYTLTLLGEKPVILSTMGRDYGPYFQWLEKNGISTKGIKIIESQFTAGAYITTDMSDNQITGFNPGAMMFASGYKFPGLTPKSAIGILAPGNLDDMMSYKAFYKQKGVPYIFDPGQSLPIWDGKKLAATLEGAAILITNDYELDLVMKMTGLSKAALQKKVEAVITTKGEHGSTVTVGGKATDIPVVPPAKVVDPTGAGDAYRGGLLKGLALGKDLVESAKLGAATASYAIEHQGTQEHHYTIAEFSARYKKTFKADPFK